MSDDQLPTKPQIPGNVQLHENGLQSGSLINQAAARLSKAQAEHLMGRAGDELLKLETKQHDLNIEYVHGKKSMEDHIDAFNMLEKTGRLTRQTVKTEIRSGNTKMQIESKSGGTCFVATAAYENADHPDVVYLRAFRDGTLMQSKKGRDFIDWYWKVGPKLATFVNRFTLFRPLAKWSIGGLVAALKMLRR